MIFIDADAFIAINIDIDAHHKKAVALLKKLEKGKEELITSWDVIGEVAMKISYYYKRETAILFLKRILKSDIILVFPDKELVQEVFEWFKKQKSKKVSLTDCTNMAIARQKEIKTFFSFDKHYKDNGFELLS